MTKPLTPSQKVKVVEYLLDVSNYDEEAKESKLLNLIYRVIHPSTKCRHAEWEQEAQEILEDINETD